MNLVKAINYTIFNWDEIRSIILENDGKHIFSYFILKNEEKIVVTDMPGSFDFEDQEYLFCGECCSRFLDAIVKYIQHFFETSGTFFDMEVQEDMCWVYFMEWVRCNVDKLSLKKIILKKIKDEK